MCHTVAMTATAHPDPPAQPLPSPRPIEVPAPGPRSDWDAWGTEPARLPPGAKALVSAVLPGRPHPVPRRRAPRLTASRLTSDDLDALQAAAGAGRATTEDTVRMLHLG